MSYRPLPLFAASTLLAGLFLSSCATEPSLYSGKNTAFGYSWEQELKLGRQSDKQIVEEMGLYHDDALAGYIEELGQRVLAETVIGSDEASELYRDTAFTFRLLDSPTVNAFALPGGYVYVTRGLLAHLENEAQLAVIIGHEITHIEARHASKRALRTQIGQIGLMAGAVLGEQISENKGLSQDLVGLGGGLLQLYTLSYGRDAEREADMRGMEYAAKAGYAVEETSAFFATLKRISDQSGQRPPSWLSTHPDPGEREQSTRRIAAQWREQLPGEAHARRREYLERIDGIVVGEDPREGFAKSGSFYHPELRFQFELPPEWTVRNGKQSVLMTAPDGRAALVFSRATGESAALAARTLGSRLELEQSFEDSARIGGLPGYRIGGRRTSRSQELEVRIATLEFGSQVYSFVGYGEAATFGRHLRAIESSSSSFRELRDGRVLSVQPYRIDVRPAERRATLPQLLPNTLPPGDKPIDWAIMNQLEIDEPVERGRLVKLPAKQR